MPVEIAAFDVDGTLTVRDCVVPFMRRVAGVGPMILSTGRTFRECAPMFAKRDRDGLKATFVRSVFTGRSVEEVHEEGVRFASHVVSSRMRNDVARRLRWHQESGHVVLLVSASLGPYLHPLGDMLEVDAVLCTELEEDSGTYTGRLLGSNCRGPEKVSRVRAWMAEAGLGDGLLDYAYGDSAGDRELLLHSRNAMNVKSIEVPAGVRS